MSSANETQVGGTHYAATYQHWDFVWDAKLGYFEAQITRYVSRSRKKNGVEDLKKAGHYIVKYRELIKSQRDGLLSAYASPYVDRFVEANGLDQPEHVTIYAISCWRTQADLMNVQLMIDVLIALREKEHVERLTSQIQTDSREDSEGTPRKRGRRTRTRKG